MSGEHQPRVSIVTATYNRSNILRCTIATVLAQTFEDWELLVVGDACTDDTEAVVAAFGDPRIRFTNLPENVGEQSGPNNVGVGLARGGYLAFVNHDDLWFPDHLATSVALLERTGADLVLAGIAVARRRDAQALARDDLSFRLLASRADRYRGGHVPASSWLLRRELARHAGPWRAARECYVEPSHDWLFRAWRGGADIRVKPLVTVVAVPSGARRNSYRERQSVENEFYARRIATDPTFRDRVVATGAAPRTPWRRVIANGPLAIAYTLAYKPLIWLGVNPRAVKFRLKYGAKGALLARLRRHRGLEDD